MMLTWLASVLRSVDLQVIEVDGWELRGVDDITVEGVVCHHTATGPNWTDTSVVRLLRDGRPDLPGPLSQLGLDRVGRFWLVAAGRCSHNGFGQWGNDSIGIEAFNDGKGEPWPGVQVDAFERGCAALVAHCGLTVNEVKGHKETDPSRKIDPLFDMEQFRSHVAAHLEDTLTPDELKTALREVLNEGTAAGQTSWAGTSKAVLAGIQANANRINARPTVQQIADAVVAALPPAQAGTLTAKQVADEIHRRLAG